MSLVRHHKAPIAWMLYFSVLFGSLLCAIGHGQMAGLSLSGVDDGEYCSIDGSSPFKGDKDLGSNPLPMTSDCVIASLFSATLLVAFFGLLALLAGDSINPLPRQPMRRLPRQRWPLLNPRASPALFPVL